MKKIKVTDVILSVFGYMLVIGIFVNGAGLRGHDFVSTLPDWVTVPAMYISDVLTFWLPGAILAISGIFGLVLVVRWVLNLDEMFEGRKQKRKRPAQVKPHGGITKRD